MSNRLIKKVSKVARNTLQEDLIRTLDLICEYAKNDIQKYKELLFIAFFNEQQVANYERFMELDYKNGWSLQDRKDRIIYTLLSKNIFTPHVLKDQAKIFTNGEIEVIEDYGNYSFTIKFTSVVGIPQNLDNFKNFIYINKFTQITGKNYGGILNITGQKEAGKAYWDNNTKKLYICKNNNSDISPNVNNYIPFDSNSLLERLENFSKLEGERLYVPNATFVKVYKIAGMVTLIVDSGTAFFNKSNTPIFNIPEKYRPNETLYFSASYRNNTKSNTFFLFANGDLIKSEVDDNLGAYYFTISYPAKS